MRGHYGLYQAFRKETDLFSDVLASSVDEELDATIDSGVPEKARVSLVSASYFSTLACPRPWDAPLAPAMIVRQVSRRSPW